MESHEENTIRGAMRSDEALLQSVATNVVAYKSVAEDSYEILKSTLEDVHVDYGDDGVAKAVASLTLYGLPENLASQFNGSSDMQARFEVPDNEKGSALEALINDWSDDIKTVSEGGDEEFLQGGHENNEFSHESYLDESYVAGSGSYGSDYSEAENEYSPMGQGVDADIDALGPEFENNGQLPTRPAARTPDIPPWGAALKSARNITFAIDGYRIIEFEHLKEDLIAEISRRFPDSPGDLASGVTLERENGYVTTATYHPNENRTLDRLVIDVESVPVTVAEGWEAARRDKRTNSYRIEFVQYHRTLILRMSESENTLAFQIVKAYGGGIKEIRVPNRLRARVEVDVPQNDLLESVIVNAGSKKIGNIVWK